MKSTPKTFDDLNTKRKEPRVPFEPPILMELVSWSFIKVVHQCFYKSGS